MAGIGAHFRYASAPARRLQWHGEGGYLALRDSSEWISGGEFAVGGTLRLTRWLAFFADYRATRLRGSSSRLELDFTDLRVGGRVTFGVGNGVSSKGAAGLRRLPAQWRNDVDQCMSRRAWPQIAIKAVPFGGPTVGSSRCDTGR